MVRQLLLLQTMTETSSVWLRCEGGAASSEQAAAGVWLTSEEARDEPGATSIDERRMQEAVHACGYDARRICQHFGVSRRTLQRWFSAHMASTMCAWLATHRLQHARRMLATSDSVKEVAYSLGFNHVSQFSRDYKRLFGHSPSAALGRVPLLTTSAVRGTPELPARRVVAGRALEPRAA